MTAPATPDRTADLPERLRSMAAFIQFWSVDANTESTEILREAADELDAQAATIREQSERLRYARLDHDRSAEQIITLTKQSVQQAATIRDLREIISFYDHLACPDDDVAAEWELGDIRHREYLTKRLADLDAEVARLREELQRFRHLDEIRIESQRRKFPATGN